MLVIRGRAFPDGSAAAPSIFFGSDPNTGLYSPAADQLGLTLGGVARLIYSAGAFAFQEATTISTTTGGLTIAPASGGILTLRSTAERVHIDLPSGQFFRVRNSAFAVIFEVAEGGASQTNGQNFSCAALTATGIIQTASGQRIQFGGTAFSTPGTNNIVLLEGTAPAGTLTDGGAIYVRDAVGVTELTYIDSAGGVSNVT